MNYWRAAGEIFRTGLGLIVLGSAVAGIALGAVLLLFGVGSGVYAVARLLIGM